MSTLDLDGFVARALAATPGPWRAEADHLGQENLYSPEMWLGMLPHQCVAAAEMEQKANAAHIAGAHPQAVLALVARVRELEEARLLVEGILREALRKEADGKSDLVLDVRNAIRALGVEP